MGWVDAARGFAIVLVVFGHAWRGLNSAGLIGDQQLFESIDRFVYLFHMPVFFLLSGMFLPALLKHASLLQSILRQVIRLLYPLVIWTYIFQLVRYLAGSSANNPITLPDILIFPLPPVDHMWFLWALFWIQIPMAAFLYLMPEWRMNWRYALIILISCILWLAIMPLPTALYPWFYNAFEYAPFVALGWLVATLPSLLRPSFAGALIAAVVFVAVGLYAPETHEQALGKLTYSMIMSIAFLTIVIALHDLSPDSTTMQWARRLGVASLTIFLAHTIFSAGIRSLLSAAGVESLSMHLILGTLVGVIAPLILYDVAKRTGTSRLLGF